MWSHFNCLHAVTESDIQETKKKKLVILGEIRRVVDPIVRENTV